MLTSGASAGDLLEVIAFDSFSVFSGTFGGDVTVGGATTLSGDLSVDTNTLYVDSTNNRVGIGTTSPVGDGLHIKVPDAGTGLVLSGTTSTAGTEVRLSALNEAASGWHNLNIGSNETIFRTAGTERMRILSTGGITFNGDTSTANALDDYEEGTWTAYLVKSGVTFNPTNTTGYYTKVGNLVYFSYYTGATQTSFSSQSGYMTFIGLPFTSASGSSQYGLFQYLHGTMFAEDVTGGYTTVNGTTGYFVVANSISNSPTVNLGSSLYLMIAGVYQTA